ncbi:SDR family oxidoreductase [Ruegeria sp.]|uniref:SDR family NAD(P)-dependent oxidoreductase n=1 Tax=Ruegeria sp. TaxID=1879320 RepID=UPI00230F316E|nr:SDR family oxidoreductase [Ruegeria sp.]MDA7963602.1 SDR family oxidoreductase [Ruegeria sp.]
MTIAIVTGAGSGIGQAIAERLAGDGYQVLINDHDASAADATVARIGPAAAAHHGDVSDPADVADMVAQCKRAFGTPTHLVNNAGHVHQASFADLSIDEFDRMIAVHLRGTFLCTKAVLHEMLNANKGCVVNVASQLGQIGGVELVHYSAAKAGILGMTKALAREVSAKGIRINAVAPGPINTPLVRALSPDWQAAKAAELPLGHFGEPGDVADTVAFLCSDAARIYVGQTLCPNSGDVML